MTILNQLGRDIKKWKTACLNIIMFNLLGFWIQSYEFDFSKHPTDAYVLLFLSTLRSSLGTFCSLSRSEHALSSLSCSPEHGVSSE